MRRIIEVPRERMRIEGSECEVAEPATAVSPGCDMLGNARFSAAGTMREEEATTMRDAIVLAAVALNWQSCL
jgi:hypothetical protein